MDTAINLFLLFLMIFFKDKNIHLVISSIQGNNFLAS